MKQISCFSPGSTSILFYFALCLRGNLKLEAIYRFYTANSFLCCGRVQDEAINEFNFLFPLQDCGYGPSAYLHSG